MSQGWCLSLNLAMRSEAPPVAECSSAHVSGKAMDVARRRLFYLAAGAAALLAGTRIMQAQSYPSRPVRVIVGLAAGGGQDIVARLMGQWLSERLGPQVLRLKPTRCSGHLCLRGVGQ